MGQAVAGEAQIEVLNRSACLDLLATAVVGRVVVGLEEIPVVLPVIMALDGDSVVFAMPRGTDLEAAVAGTTIAIEADLLDRLTGWSVVVTGRADPLPGGRPAPAGPWPSGSRLFRLPVRAISGRRLANRRIHVGGTVRPATVAAVNRAAAAAGRPGYGGCSELIPVAECFRLLGAEEVGRLAVIVDGQPLVFPVNYALDGDVVVFRTAPGAKLEAISQSLATFEVDRWIPEDGSGWAVTVEGFAVPVPDDPGTVSLQDRMAALPLFPWVPGHPSHLVRIMPVSVSGSRWRPSRDVVVEPDPSITLGQPPAMR